MDSVGSILPGIAAIALILYTSRLAYLQLHKEKRDRLLERYKQGTPVYDIYQKAYSTRALLGSLLLTLGFISDLLMHVYKSMYAHPSSYVLTSIEICGLAFLLSGAYVSSTLFREKLFKF
jgi:hypothetical protein